MSKLFEITELGQILMDLAEELDVPASKYEEATAHYSAVGDWLNADGSDLAKYGPTIYPQGSFALGTAVKPIGDGDYDVDAVCLLRNPPAGLTQQQLKAMVGKRLKFHDHYGRMLQAEGRRCWTLKYADASKFHLDVLPAIPHRLLGHREAIHTTDREAPDGVWGDSNPKGYQTWFKDRMKVVFDQQRERAALAKTASVEDVPEYEIRTPLQRLIQILKWHRDWHYGNDEDKPISIIITTLAARAYNNEGDLHQAMVNVIPQMRDHITHEGGIPHVSNPVIPTENFADKWASNPRKRQVFYQWLDRVEAFGAALAGASTEEEIQAVVDGHFGAKVAAATLRKFASRKGELSKASSASLPKAVPYTVTGPQLLQWRNPFAVNHRELPKWIADNVSALEFRAKVSGGPEGTKSLRNGETVPKGRSLHFEVLGRPGISEMVFWQVVNTGDEARVNRNLRGQMIQTEKTSKTEDSKYTGEHWVECFFVKMNGRGEYQCTARSGEFLVRIA